MPVLRSSDVTFAELPGRWSANPFPGVPDSTARLVRIPPGPRTPHRHPHSSELVYVAEGSGSAWENGKRSDVSAGDLLSIPAGVPHATVAGASGLLLICFFPHPDLTNNLEELSGPVLS